MCDDIYYYKDRCGELEAEIAVAKSTIDNLQKKLYDVRMVVRNRAFHNAEEILNTIYFIIYN